MVLRFALMSLIGKTLVAEGFGQNIPKGDVCVSMAFSVLVEFFKSGVRVESRVQPV